MIKINEESVLDNNVEAIVNIKLIIIIRFINEDIYILMRLYNHII